MIVVGADTHKSTARAILERRESSIKDPVLGWKQVDDAHPMKPSGGRGGSVWVAKNIDLPAGSGKYRIVVEQYEELPVDKRVKGFAPRRGKRLVFSDVIPLSK